MNDNDRHLIFAFTAIFGLACAFYSTHSFAGYYIPTPDPVEECATHSWYIAGRAGVDRIPSMDISGEFTGTVELDFNTGYNVGGAIGYRVDALRFEAEYLYIHSGVDDISIMDSVIEANNTVFSGQGRVRVHAGMGNMTFGLDHMLDIRIHPYIGGGIGYANVEVTGTNIDGIGEVFSGSHGTFAFQGIVGFGFYVMDNALITIDYRYFGTTKAQFNSTTAEGVINNQDLEERFQSHMISATLVAQFDIV